MATGLQESLQELQRIDGFIAAAIAHGESGMALGSIGGGDGFDIDFAVAVNTEVLKAKHKAMKSLGLDGGIEDILITLDVQYHLIRPLRKNPIVFIYIAVNRASANLAMTRLKLGLVEENLNV